MKRSVLENVALVACAFTTSGLVAKSELGFWPSQSAFPKQTPVQDWVRANA